MALRFLAMFAVLMMSASVFAVSLSGREQPQLYSREETEWKELQVEPPVAPSSGDLVEFFIGTGTGNRFFIDGRTLSVGKDGVVRYVLVIKTAGGATNIAFEGIRCQTGEYKLYASGRADGTWAPSRIARWRSIEDNPTNRHHAVLNRDLLCPMGIPISSPEEGLDAVRRGKHPRAL